MTEDGPNAELFGRYRLDELLGAGGMGEVHRAFDTQRQRVVAVKRILTRIESRFDYPTYAARFRREAVVVARLDHPHIVPVHDYGEIDGQPYIDMRYVAGVDLARMISQRIPADRALRIISQTADALDAAHAAELVHRDIKPTNILVTQYNARDFAYLVDFGIVRALRGSGATSLTQGVIGTVFYMSPEALRDRSLDRRADVYSLGCVLYECLTGRPPYEGTSDAVIIQQHLAKDAPRVSEARKDLPTGLDDVISTALEKDPDKRFDSAGALAKAARECFARATRQHPDNSPTRARVPKSTRPEASYIREGPAILRYVGEIEDVSSQSRVTVFCGEPGSGRSTLLPGLLKSFGWGTLCIVAQDRYSAEMLARRLPRSDNGMAIRTPLELLMEAETDRLLSAYHGVLIDDADRGSPSTDVLLALLRRLLKQRHDLRLGVVVGAAKSVNLFSRFLGDAPVVLIIDKEVAVNVVERPDFGSWFKELTSRSLARRISRLVLELTAGELGDVLVFLPDIATALAVGQELESSTSVAPVALHEGLMPDQYLDALTYDRSTKPRVFLTTQVAEAYAPAPRVRHVVDCGLNLYSRQDLDGVTNGALEWNSRDNTARRTHLSSQQGAGTCLRLYNSSSLPASNSVLASEPPVEGVAAALLALKLHKLGDPAETDILRGVNRRRLRKAEMLLGELGATGIGGSLDDVSAVGRQLGHLPVDIRLGRALLKAHDLACLTEVVVIVAWMTACKTDRSLELLLRSSQRYRLLIDERSDALTVLNLWRHNEQRHDSPPSDPSWARRQESLALGMWSSLVERLRRSSLALGLRFNRERAKPDAIHEALVFGFLSSVAVRESGPNEGGLYSGCRGKRFKVSAGSALEGRQSEFILALVRDRVPSSTEEVEASFCVEVDRSVVESAAGDLVSKTYSEPVWNKKKGTTLSSVRITLFGVVLADAREVDYASVDPEVAREYFLDYGLARGATTTTYDFQRRNSQLLQRHPGIASSRVRLPSRSLPYIEAWDVKVSPLVAFYDERVPSQITTQASFDRWWKSKRREHPELLDADLRSLRAIVDL